jgi:phosphoribosylaminoimidazole (AIR) synthetase
MTLEVAGELKISPYENLLLVPVKSREKAAKAIEEVSNAKYPVVCEIRQQRPKRSLNANAYCWVLIDEIAEVTNQPSDVVYEAMLRRYSKAYTYMIVKPEAAEKVKATLKAGHIYAYDIGTVKVGDKEGVQLQLYYGSSTFDTKQFARFLDGIISEAKELGIDVITPEQKQLLLDQWGK